MPSVLKLNFHVYQAIIQYIKILFKTLLCCFIINMHNWSMGIITGKHI